MTHAHGGAPARRPCGSCPYRRDTPPGVWSRQEYEKLPPYDEPETGLQPPAAFFCHQQDGRLCAGWVAVHDMDESLGLRMACRQGLVTARGAEVALDYTTDVPLYSSGTEAAARGLSDVENPSHEARAMVTKLRKVVKSPKPPTDLESKILHELSTHDELSPSWIADNIFYGGGEAWPFEVRKVSGALGRMRRKRWVSNRHRGRWSITDAGRDALVSRRS